MTDSNPDISQTNNKRSQFGNRYLKDENKVFEHNAWDDIEWDESLKQSTHLKISQNSENKVSDDLKEIYERDAYLYWDQFYDKHENKFFKDRHWLFTEFPELMINKDSDNETKEKSIDSQTINDSKLTTILEMGCGVGNTVFPLLEINSNPNVFIYCCDFSSTAVSLVKENRLYDEKRCNAFTLDITSEKWSVPFPQSSLSIVTIIFVLSAIDPKRMEGVIHQIAKYLKPGGLLLFRDYGRYDMTQVRFKDGHCIEDNFYVRGDGTRAYFFTENEIDSMFSKAGLKKLLLKVDKRLQVNRAKQVKMYRVWIQAKYVK